MHYYTGLSYSIFSIRFMTGLFSYRYFSIIEYVSYTHLDVYKRQTINKDGTLKANEELVKKADADTLNSVSYTHLDVYKRQIVLSKSASSRRSLSSECVISVNSPVSV